MPLSACANASSSGYRAAVADAACGERVRRPKAAKLASNAALRAVVEQRLQEKWSPQQIAGWLHRTYPEDEAMQISHETIYLSMAEHAKSRSTAACRSCPARLAR